MIARRRRLTVVALLCGLVSALAFACAPASALHTHLFSSSFGSVGSGAGQVSSPAGVAIDLTTHDIYVADTGNFRVDEFSSSGTFIRAWGWGVADGLPSFETCTLVCQAGLSGSGAGQFTTPTFVAVDNSAGPSAGDVYVGDTGDNLVSKFDSAGNLIGGWGAGGQLNGSSATNGPFGAIAGVAVDPGGTLIVINGSSLVFEFSQSGSFTTDFNVERGTSPNGLAVDSTGNLFKTNGDSSVEEITGSNRDLGQVTPGAATEIAVDPATGDLYADAGGSVAHYAFSGAGHVVGSGGSTCTVAPLGGCAASDSFGSGNLTGGTGIAVDPASGSVYVADAAANRIDLFIAAVLPDVTTGVASLADPTKPTLSGVVVPDGVQITGCRFEYGTSASYGQTVACKQTPGEIGAGSGPVPVSAEVSGLLPSTEYHFRLVAANAAGAGRGADGTFVAPGPPLVGSEFTTDVASTSATIDAQIDPSEASTEYRIEYGTSTSYGHTFTGNVGNGSSEVPISNHLQGLEADTTYHYRIDAINVFGTVAGADRTFTTQAAGGQELTLLDGRAWEMVSPPNKSGALIEGYIGTATQAASDGSGITYGASDAIGENPVGKTAHSQILSTRGPGGWRSQDISLPHSLARENEIQAEGYEYQLFSPDLSLAAIWQGDEQATTQLAPEATEGKLYLRNNLEQSYLPLLTAANIPPGTNLREEHNEVERKIFFGTATPDLGHVIFSSRLALTPEAVEGQAGGGAKSSKANLYEWSAGRLQPVNVLPSEVTGERTEPGAYLGGQEGLNGGMIPRTISSDGRWVVWTLGWPYNVFMPGEPSSLYVRDMVRKKTVKIGGGNAIVQTMSSDGSKILFLEGSIQSGLPVRFIGGELYEFDTATGVQTALTSDHGVGESTAGVQDALLGASEDGSWVYFVANGVLGDGAERGATTGNCIKDNFARGEEGACNLYVWHDGTTRYIARLSSEDELAWYLSAFYGGLNLGGVRSRVSPDGRYLTFMSSRSLTSYDNIDANSGKPDEEVYLYDAVTNRLVCASCDPTGARPVGVLASVAESSETRLLGGAERGISGFNGQWLAGITPRWEELLHNNAFHQPRFLSDSGRLFFESPDALVPQDTNGRMDVYEYEPAGVGSCTAASVTFSERSDGCVGLVSSGTSSQESAFYDASESGDDVFFLTASRLSPADYDTSLDVYDAHVCSAAVPCVSVPVPPPPCTSGDSCKVAPSPQPEVFGATPSATFSGAGNVVEEAGNGVVERVSKPKHKQHTKRRKRKAKKAGGFRTRRASMRGGK
ncbi:MAG TPA: hypothetical protein VNY52_12765 [Solirubrobacteraceae bacterium]|jgi:DNA-binding beta-propeller fold protein YncE|nr:hypothetical protein [Solirubrobacteraceae bacterium]